MTTKPQTQPIREIMPGIYHIQVSLADTQTALINYVNSYLIKGTHGWLLIDPGWSSPLTQPALETGLKSLNLTLTDISTIVVTHCHPDHYGFAGKIKQLCPQTRLLMHRWEANLIESRYVKFTEPQKKMRKLLIAHGVPLEMVDELCEVSMSALEFITLSMPDDFLYGGEIIQTGVFDLEVIWTPGHSPGHICLYEARNRLLFCGDHVLPSISPNISYHILSGDNPLGDYIYSLGKLGNLPVTQVHPGHEYSFDDLQGRAQVIMAHHNQREKEIVKIMDNGSHSSYKIAAKLHWNIRDLAWEQFPPLQKRFAITETMAHLEHLRWNGKVQKSYENGLFKYNLV